MITGSQEVYLCTRCKEKFSLEEVKYDRRAQLVCLKCLGSTEPKRERKTDVRSFVRKMEPSPQFICMDCRYRFRRKQGSTKNDCPYCGSSQLMNVKRLKDLNDLIDSSMDERFDY